MGRTNVILAASPTSWGVDFPKAPHNPPWRMVLRQIRATGLAALELGPVGYLPPDASAALADHSLAAVGSFLFENLHHPAHRAEVLNLARQACAAIVASDGDYLVIIDRPTTTRVATAGRFEDAPRLTDDAWLTMIGTIEEIAAIATDHHLQPVVHPHAGSYIEFVDEIERVLDTTTLPLCLDTGHLAYAAIDPARALSDYGSRIKHLHLKDIAGPALEKVLRVKCNFWTAIRLGIFCPLGAGVVDFGTVAAALDTIGYQGYATIEQDRVPGSGDPLGDLEASIDVLTRAGIGQLSNVERVS
jgi:inosose dehydratase